MANTPVEVLLGITGRSNDVLKLYPRGNDSIANGAGGDTLVEETNRVGCYQTTVTQALDGIYEAYVFDSSGDLFFTGMVYMVDGTTVCTVVEGDSVLAAALIVAGVTQQEALRRIGALTSGIVSGAGTGTETFKDYEESASTIVITVDGSGNRSAITYN